MTALLDRRLKPFRHGSDAGYARHWKARRPACEACKRAHADAEARRYAARANKTLVSR